MNPGLVVEDSIRALLALQPQCTATVPDEILRSIRVIRERCIQAEASESVDGLSSWRRSHMKQGSNAREGKSVQPYKWRGTASGGPPAARQAPHSSPPNYAGKYVSKFKSNDTPVEETILNQVILNKLNKFSLTNYDDVKSFLQQILDGDDKTFLKRFMDLVFQKAASEPTFCPLYARMISELAEQYETLRQELKSLYTEYLFIFDEVMEQSNENYDQFVQRSKEKRHRLGYSQFLAELTTRGALDTENIKNIFMKIIEQIKRFGSSAENHQQLVEEYTQCLLRMSQAFTGQLRSDLHPIRRELYTHCSGCLTEILQNRQTKYPGISKKASFACMDCFDILKVP